MDTSEKNFEEAIERAMLAGGPDAYPAAGAGPSISEPASAGGYRVDLPAGLPEPGGYRRRTSADYDKALCLIPADVIDFIYATQAKEWVKLEKQFSGGNAEARQRLLQRLSSEIKSRGTLDVLRKGIKLNGCAFRLVYFRPSSTLNPDLQKLYQGNLFSLMRQLHFSEKRPNDSLDMALFLNGLPLFTAELKNPFKGQDVKNAIHQYRTDRDPKEPLFAFGRCLAHFAVDPDQIFMTSQLEGPKTRFLPFNQGRDGGAGNPPSLSSFATAYLWEQVWARDSVLNLLEHFIHEFEEEDEAGRKTGIRRMIFPRYHQLDAVRRMVADARTKGVGQHYLIQHSAGSGKSNSIAWLAHQLSVLHDAQNHRVFDSILVITDRRVLDRQLQRTVRLFEQTLGIVENIDTTSKQLKQALEEGKTIIVTTLQKFPVIVEQMVQLSGQRFAVIIDEAHSSQSGESTKSLKKVLNAPSLEEAEEDERQEKDEAEELQDRIADEMRARGRLPNLSTFAFTATPKTKTLELFGQKRPDGKFEPFSLYSMRQAIEEGFILDVLENYTTYTTYWNLLKKIETDPSYDRAKASQLLKAFVDLHRHAIAKKVELMVEHFAGQVAPEINGRAKAMIVTRSRLHAVRYKQAVDQYLKDKGYNYKALVAFSGTVKDGGLDYTEANMNGLPETQTAKAFERDEYRLLIVANKFQTGFDQPLLHTMYVDKKLGGVNAVQTLSRLNRVHPGKTGTMVLDFENSAEEIQEAFEPYYQKTLLSEATDPNLLYDMQTQLSSFQLYDQTEIENFAARYFDPTATQDKLNAALDPVVQRYIKISAEEQSDFRRQLTNYIRLYAFLSQILPFVDTELEKFYEFARHLLRKLPTTRERLPLEVQQNIDIDSYRVQQTSKGKIALRRGTSELDPIGPKGSGYTLTPDETELLSQIIEELNRRFGTSFNEEDKVCIRNLEERVDANPALQASQRVNSRENLRLTFEQVVNDQLQGMLDTHFKFYKQVNDDPEFAKALHDLLFERYLGRADAA